MARADRFLMKVRGGAEAIIGMKYYRSLDGLRKTIK
jgi:hypothetical protein